ncbi:MAG: glucose-1-phosphate adenylyltransferase [Candidatus Omnitrophica bacterium]|nr:glucose-1-phosphate adenylyltransferase [Candidatus Omnitrophota bacterium]
MKNVLAIILGGGRGARLLPLTKYRAKPAVPIAGKYRLIDIPISNCLNSGFNKIYILTQFLSESLNKHISRTYKLDSFSHGFVEIIAAEQSMEKTDWFQGTADAVRQSLKHFTDPRFEYFLILSGDQLYAIDLREVMKTHLEKGAEVTVCCKPIPAEEVAQLGVMKVNREDRITHFVEKPQDPKLLQEMSFVKGGRKFALASMGIYVFNRGVLKELLTTNDKTDFGRGIIPDAIPARKVYAHLFEGYWIDIGTIKTYYEASLSLTSKNPPINLYNEEWPYYTRGRSLPISRLDQSHIECSVVADGSLIEGAEIRHSVIGLRSAIGAGTRIESSILMGNDYFEDGLSHEKNQKEGIPDLGIGKNCLIQKAIIDKNVRIGDNVKIINPQGKTHFEGPYFMIQDGITVVEKNAVIPSGTTL